MARTPLMRALQRMASEHAEASEKGISVEEVRHLRRATIGRRDLLKGAGALAAGLALTDPLGLAGHMLKAAASSPPRIAIIGGGISGLHAALTPHDAGYAPTLFQTPSRPGGGMHPPTSR